jgi:hypothetical protein
VSLASDTWSVIHVVERPSAAGKTTWLSQWDQALVIAEFGRIEPQLHLAHEESEFWADLNADRWSREMTVEAAHGMALCYSDPLKLHYDYCPARAGAALCILFEAGVRTCAAAIAQRRRPSPT